MSEENKKPVHGYVGWLIPEFEREALLRTFKPVYPDVIAHHITLRAHANDAYPLPEAVVGAVVGYVDDGNAVQALVFEIDGTTTRPDGRTYHCTWSIDRSKGAKPVHSNTAIKENGFVPVPKLFINIVPKFFPFDS